MTKTSQPLADRIRPKFLQDFVGQRHLVGENKPLYQTIKTGKIQSMILWGPPGVGKTTLARIIANETEHEIVILSAVSASKEDIRQLVSQARSELTPMEELLHGKSGSSSVILFLDEIHRFNKAQQDFLLPYVEDGTIVLIGATTENPSFEVIPALLSRSQVFVLEPLAENELAEITQRGCTELEISLDVGAVEFLVNYANGDGRKSLNLLEAAASLYTTDAQRVLKLEHFKNAVQSKFLRYDKAADEHYDTISAFIKSMRASNVDATLYYLARMIHAGEDPKFIARRMVIFASEDIGLGQPTALVVANSVFRAVETIGYPECQINLAHGAAYLALSNKDRSSYEAYFQALEDVDQFGNLPIPLNLRNAPTSLMKSLGYGKDYEPYTNKDLLPEKLKGRRYFQNDNEK